MTLRLNRLWWAWLVGMLSVTALAGCAVLAPAQRAAVPRSPGTNSSQVRGDANLPRPTPALQIAEPPQIGQSSASGGRLSPVAAQNPEVLGLTAAPIHSGVPASAPTAPTGLVTAQAVEPVPAGVSPLVSLYQKAAQRYSTIDSYIMRLKRREVVNDSQRPEEIMLCKFRKNPWAVYFKWLSEEGKGREVVFVKGKYNNQINTLTADGDIPFLGPGKRFNIAADSFLVKGKSRYPITEAGLGSLIEKFGRLVAANEKGDDRGGSLKYLGMLKRPEFEAKVEGALQTLPPRSDGLLPKGGQRWWFFDPSNNLPVLLITHDENGREVEYYCHDRFQFPVHLDDDDFNPDKLWKVTK